MMLLMHQLFYSSNNSHVLNHSSVHIYSLVQKDYCYEFSKSSLQRSEAMNHLFPFLTVVLFCYPYIYITFPAGVWSSRQTSNPHQF